MHPSVRVKHRDETEVRKEIEKEKYPLRSRVTN